MSIVCGSFSSWWISWRRHQMIASLRGATVHKTSLSLLNSLLQNSYSKYCMLDYLNCLKPPIIVYTLLRKSMLSIQTLWSVSIELDTAQRQIRKNYWCRWASSGSGEANFIPDTICWRLTDQWLKTFENAFVTTSILERRWRVGQPLVNHMSTVDRPAAPAGG